MFKPGQIFFTTNKTLWYSQWIRWFEKKTDENAEFTHVGLLCGGGIDNAEIFESTWPKIRKSYLAEYVKFDSKTVVLEHPSPDLTTLPSFIKKYNGKIYGLPQLLGLGMLKIFNLKHSPLHQGIICLELILLWLKTWIKELCNIDENSMDVHQFYKLCLEHGYKVKYICDYGTKTWVEAK